jgi:hypothetical protein
MSEQNENNFPLNPPEDAGFDEIASATASGTVETVEESAVHVELHPAVAPRWHTFVLVVALLLFSWLGTRGELKDKLNPAIKNNVTASASGTSGKTAIKNNTEKTTMSHSERLLSYGTTVAFEFIFLGWVWFGMHLRGVPLRSLLGNQSYGWLRTIGIAAIFWIIAMVVLGTCGVSWLVAEKGIQVLRHPEHNSTVPVEKNNSGSKTTAKTTTTEEKPSNEKPASALLRLAPTNALECFLWLLLSMTAGLCEEIIFRGYLQRQFSNLFGKAAIGAVFSALCFGLSHGYEGARSMFLITIFGVLFSVLALRMRSLKPGMVAHAWHDLLTGYAIAALKATGVF